MSSVNSDGCDLICTNGERMRGRGVLDLLLFSDEELYVITHFIKNASLSLYELNSL
jgi:hypothetical protein